MFIGLGGFGGQTLREIRKCEFLNKETVAKNNANSSQFNVEYLYCDSSMDICGESQKWRVFGEDISLKPADIINLREQAIAFDKVDKTPHVKSWLGSEEGIFSHLLGMGSEHGANQRRRFGRYLFANSAEKFLTRIRKKVGGMGVHECTFHIFATFAGGTGSGSIIDAITIIRNEYKSDKDFPIFVYGYATSRNDDDGHDVGFFYPNQYSVIRDLNGLMIGKYQPQILTSNNIERTDPTKKYVDAAYIITPFNRNRIQYEPQDQVAVVGNWAYQRVMTEVFGYLGADVRKAFTGEDHLAAFRGEASRDTGEPVRAARFGSIGLIRWRIPEEETEEALIAEYSVQAYQQMLDNKWDAANGYIPSQEGSASKDENLLSEFGLGSMAAWNLSTTEDHKTYEDEWTRVSESFEYDDNKGLIANMKDLIAEFNDYSNQGFRGTGINSYYEARNNSGLHQQIESFEQFLKEWADRKWLSGDCGVRAILAHYQALMNMLAGQLAVLKQEANEPQISVERIEKKWRSHADKPGLLARQLGIEKKMYAKMRRQVADAYIQECKLKGASYAIRLCEVLRQSVQSTINAIQQSESLLKKILVDFNEAKNGLLKYPTSESGDIDPGKDVVEFKREAYNNIWRVMCKNRTHIDNLINECRKKILHGHLSLTTLHSVKQDDLVDSTKQIANEGVRPGHDKACQKDPNLIGKEILGKSIWQALERKGSQAIDRQIKEFLQSSVTMAKRSADKFTHNTLKLPLEKKVLLCPNFNADGGLDLKKLFKDNDGQGSLEFVSHDEPSEMVCLTVDAAAPARLFSVVHDLEQKYQKSMLDNPDTKYFVHLDYESQEEANLPSVLDK